MGRRKKTVAALLAAGVLGGILTLGGGSVKADNEPVKAHPNAVVYQAEDASMTGGARKATDHTGYTEQDSLRDLITAEQQRFHLP